jgi:major membrane immunogen (membrane-anchored lipoprotein)
MNTRVSSFQQQFRKLAERSFEERFSQRVNAVSGARCGRALFSRREFHRSETPVRAAAGGMEKFTG